MTAVMTKTNPTIGTIQEAILAALADGDVHTWSEVRRNLPGTRWQQVEAAVALSGDGRIDSTRFGVDPETYMSIPLIAA